MLKAITAEAALEISNMSLEHRGGFLNRYVTRVDTSPENIRQMLQETVWAKCIEKINALNLDTEPLAVEKALSVLIKRKALKERVACKRRSFRIQLANSQYRAYREEGTDYIRACPWPAKKQYVIRISGGRFADFLLQFDAGILEMLSRVPAIMDAIRTRELEERKELIETELKERVITSVIDQFLKPLGLNTSYVVGEGDRVILDISQVLSAHLEIPLWQLPEKLKDVEAVMAMLHVVQPKGDNPFDMGHIY